MDSLVPTTRVQTADGLTTLTAPITVATSITETVLLSYLVGANFLAVGTTFAIMAGGVAGTTTAAPTLTLRLRRGGIAGTQLASLVVTPAVSQTNKGWWTEWLVTCRAAGGAGTVMAQGFCLNELNTVAPNFAKLAGSTATAVWDTTAQASLDLTAQWSVSNAANTLTIHNGIVMLSKA